MKLRLLILLALTALTLSNVLAQIDPPEPVYGFLRVCNTEGSFALRELPEGGATVLATLTNDDLIEPLNEFVYPGGIEWRRVKAGIEDGWVRPTKANGNELTVCLSTNNAE